MYRLILSSIIVLGAALNVAAQSPPHGFKQDTPPVPGQVIETPREKLRLAPAPTLEFRTQGLGLPSSGPKGLLRELSNEDKVRAERRWRSRQPPLTRRRRSAKLSGAGGLVRRCSCGKSARGAVRPFNGASISSPMLLVASRQSPAIGI